jgi:hypothetical protein
MRVLIEVEGGCVTRITRAADRGAFLVFVVDHASLKAGDKFAHDTFPVDCASNARFNELLEELAAAPVPAAQRSMGVLQAENVAPDDAPEWTAPDGLD